MAVSELRRHPALLQAHADEAGADSVVDVNWQFYEQQELEGDLILLGVYDAGDVVGYSAAVLTEHPNSGVLQCLSLAVYVRPEYRGGVDLLLSTELEARKHGARRILWSAKPGSKLDTVLRQRKGVHKHEVTYAKEL